MRRREHLGDLPDWAQARQRAEEAVQEVLGALTALLAARLEAELPASTGGAPIEEEEIP
jgi:hypothetical protein